ncbi:uncharacterized protein [Branchiostoma lanceolatum]|uniref:uncharacterized protein n=1 Tax=Branchiostoma lanceolatum TaxID=7740 RepID=UPI003456B6D0
MQNVADTETLLRHRPIIVNGMNIAQLNQILDAIYSKKIITKEEHDLVKSCPLSQDRARHLLDIIGGKGEKTCCRFLKRLKKVNKSLWREVTGRTASKQRGRKRKAECEVEVRPDRSTLEASQSYCDDGGTWKCEVSEDKQARKIRLCLSRHPQCLSSEDSLSHQGQESPDTVSDSSSSCLSSASSVDNHSNDTRMRSTSFALNIKAKLLKHQSHTRAEKAEDYLKANLRQYTKNIKRKVFKIFYQSFVRVKKVHRGSLLCTVYLETYPALQSFVSRDQSELCAALKDAIITPEMEAAEEEEVVLSVEVLPSHSMEKEDESDSSDVENEVPRKKLPFDEAPSCSYTKEGSLPKPPLEMYKPPPTPLETPPPMCTAVWGSQEDGECTVQLPEQLYPTPDDAWAWLHCLEEFFQKDSTSAMAIRTAWSANQLVKHIIRDRYFHHYLCRFWHEKAIFPNSFSDFMDFFVLTSAKDFWVENGHSQPDSYTFQSKCLHLGEIAFIQQIVHGSKSQPAIAEDVPEFSFGWLQRSKGQNSPTERSPGHDQLCMYVHDSIRQYLMARWVAEIISDRHLRLSMSEHLTSFYEVASSLPVTCYCLANFLGKLPEPEDKLFQVVGPLLKEVWIDPKVDFQRFLLTTMIVESKQYRSLTEVLRSLFPYGLVDLSSFPDLSYHNLHSLRTVVKETDIIQSFKLPGNVQSESLMGPCPLNSDESVEIRTNKMRCIPYVSLVQCLTIKQGLDFSNIEYIRCNDDNLVKLRDLIQFLPDLKTLSFRPQTKFDLRPLNFIAPALLFTPNLSSVLLADNYITFDDDSIQVMA